jgi:nicotinamide mononucleotide transporter PnuC
MKNKQNKLSESLLSAARYFSATELAIWISSLLFITLSSFIFDGEGYLAFFASLLGVTSLIFLAKGNPIGQVLIIIFSLIYGAISYSFSYYGEMATYLGMSMPMAVFSLITWLRHPYKNNRSEVEVNSISKKEHLLMWPLTALVTVVFYFILTYFGTANLIPSTLSVGTSFLAVYLTSRRSPFYALAYAANDIILIVLWVLASLHDASYVSVVVCFIAFLSNDIYGFVNWQRMKKRQANG